MPDRVQSVEVLCTMCYYYMDREDFDAALDCALGLLLAVWKMLAVKRLQARTLADNLEVKNRLLSLVPTVSTSLSAPSMPTRRTFSRSSASPAP